MSIVVAGRLETVPGVVTSSFLDAGGPRHLGPDDYRERTTKWVRSVIMHCTVGDEPQIVEAGAGPAGMAARTIAAWASDNRHAGAHLVIDGDGSVLQVADIIDDATYHAESINGVSVGVELAQSSRLQIWSAQLAAMVRLLDWMTARLGIQRQFHAPYLGDSHPVARLAAGGADAVGCFGHRDQSDRRGKGDPGDAVFQWLKMAGYEAFNFARGDDLAAWKVRQRGLAGLVADGIPGPATARALAAVGRRRGMWVARPGD